MALNACTRGAESAPEQGGEAMAPFQVARPVVKDISLERQYVADIRAARHAELRSRFRGVLESVAVDEGATVKAGQTLFTINAKSRQQDVLAAKAAALGAKAELEAAQLELDNTKLLADKNVVSAAELARAKSKVQLAHAKLEEANAAEARAAVELDRAQIRAPFDGVINRIPRKAGSAVGEDDLLTTITDAREVVAYFAISEREYLQVLGSQGNGQHREVTLLLADGTKFAQPGQIDSVGSEIDADTGTLTYRARFANPDGVLKHGSSGKIVLATTLRAAEIVPQKSTFEVQGDYYVYAVDASQVAHARKLQIKARLGEDFAIDGGLARDERFVLEGVQKLKDGVKIEVREPRS